MTPTLRFTFIMIGLGIVFIAQMLVFLSNWRRNRVLADTLVELQTIGQQQRQTAEEATLAKQIAKEAENIAISQLRVRGQLRNGEDK